LPPSARSVQVLTQLRNHVELHQPDPHGASAL
jgi:hypothetical protein